MAAEKAGHVAGKARGRDGRVRAADGPDGDLEADGFGDVAPADGPGGSVLPGLHTQIGRIAEGEVKGRVSIHLGKVARNARGTAHPEHAGDSSEYSGLPLVGASIVLT
jgi:hypothetical protein